MSVEVTADNLRELFERDGIVFIDWWAPGCAPCVVMGATCEKVLAKNRDIVFARVDTHAQKELAALFDIRSAPTIMIRRDRVLLFFQPGALPEEALEDLLRKTRALDMDKVRARLTRPYFYGTSRT